MYEPGDCERCETRLYGPHENEAGICEVCARPAEVRRRSKPRTKPSRYRCKQCGVEAEQGVMGRPRQFCPTHATSTARRLRALCLPV